MEARRFRGHRARAAAAERLPPHAHRIDLVDEDDALAAPLARELLRFARQEADDDHVHPDEGLREAGARHRHDRRVEASRDRLGEHRLACSGCAEEEDPALAAASRLLEGLARLPEVDHAPDLFLGLRLTADVVELHAPVRVAGLEAPDLRDAHQEHRSEQDPEVEEEEDAEEQPVGRVARGAFDVAGEPVPRVSGRAEEGRAVDAVAQQPDDENRHYHQREEVGDLRPEAPEPDAPAGDHVLLAQRWILDSEQARPADEAVEEEIEHAAEGGYGHQRANERPADCPALLLVQVDEDRGRGEHRDPGRDAPERAPLGAQQTLLFP